jgi:hypothetical protein
VDVLAVTHVDVALPDSVVVGHYQAATSIRAHAKSLRTVVPIRQAVDDIPATISQRTGVPLGWISTGPTSDDKQRVG